MSSLKHLILNCLFALLFFGYASASNPRLTDLQVPEECRDILLPDTASYAIFVVDDHGFMKYQKILVKSFPSGADLWSLSFNTPNIQVYALDFGVLVNNGNHSTLYDITSGKKLFKMKAIPALVDSDRKILVGYQGDDNDKLVAFDLSSGKQLWKTNVNKSFGYPWEKILPLDTNTAIYSGGDIWKLDISTGERQSFKVKRHIFNKGANAASAAAGVLGAFAGGIFMYSPSYFSDFGSEVLTQPDGRLFVADRDAVTCVDTTLNIVWRTTLPEKTGSKSYLRLRGDTLEMLNTGQALSGDRITQQGKAFIASFNKNTGDSISFRSIAKKWNKDDYGDQLYFVGDPFYAFDYENEVVAAVDYPQGTFPLVTLDGDISIVDHTMTEVKRYPLNDLFYKFADFPEGTGLIRVVKAPATEIVVINADGKITDSMEGTAPLRLLNKGRFVTIYNGSLVIYNQ